MSGKRDKFQIREFRNGDEQALVDLSNRYYESYPGSVHRDRPYFSWAYVQNPAVSSDDIFVAEDSDRIVAFGVVMRGGRVLDLCYESDEQGKSSLPDLITAIVDSVQKKGWGRIRIDSHSDDKTIREVMMNLGFSERRRKIRTAIRCVDFGSLIQNMIGKREISKYPILLKLYGDPPPDEELYISGEKVASYTGREPRPRIVIQVEKRHLTRIIFGNASISSLILTRKIRVSPMYGFLGASRSLERLKLGSRWGPMRGPIYWD